jgi:hypothetical protein
MQATEKFTLRISPEDRENFAELKRLFKRSSQSDAIRYVVRETLKAFGKVESSKQGQNQKTRSRK